MPIFIHNSFTNPKENKKTKKQMKKIKINKDRFSG